MNETSLADRHNLDIVEDDSVVLIRTVFLVFILIGSLIGNSTALFFLILASKRTLNPFRAYLISMSAYGLLECSLNISLASGFSIEGKWVFNKFMQGFNACFLQLQSIGTLLTITVMSIDRFVAVGKGKVYLQESYCHKANYVVLYTWFHAFVFSLPLLFQNQSLGLTVRSFLERNTCGLSEYTSEIYSVSVLVICFVFPIVVIAIFVGLVFVKIKQENKKHVNMPYYWSYSTQNQNHSNTTKFIVVLFALYLSTKVPYIAVDFLTQFNFASAYIPVNQSISNNSLEFVANGNKFYYQTGLTWLSFCFSAIYPVVMFSWFNEYKNRLKETCCCVKFSKRKSVINKKVNNVPLHQRSSLRFSSNNSTNNDSATVKQDRKRSKVINQLKQTINQNKTFKVPVIYQNKIPEENQLPGPGFRIPVLYAAADGLHLVASNSQMARSSSDSQKNIVQNGSSGYAGSESDRGISVKSMYNYNIPTERESDTKQTKLNPTRFFKRLYSGATVNAENYENRVVETSTNLSRPTSVVDKRLDVKGSIKSDDESYFQSSDMDEDHATESELNQSANSRTLILPSLDKDDEIHNNNWQVLPHTPSPTPNSPAIPLSLTNLEKHNMVNNNLKDNVSTSQQTSDQNIELDYLKSFQT